MTSPQRLRDIAGQIVAAHSSAECYAGCEDPFCPYVHHESFGDHSRDDYDLARGFLSLLDEIDTLSRRVEAAEREGGEAVKSHEHTKYWYATRFERIKDSAKQHGIWPEIAAIIANGTADPLEPPTYAQQLNIARYQAEAAEAKVERLMEALRPFATLGELMTDEDGWGDSDDLTVEADEHYGPFAKLKSGDFRGARAALTDTPDPGKDNARG